MDKKEQFKNLVNTDPNFVFSKKYNYNIDNLLQRYKEGCSNKLICTVLILKSNELNKIYNNIVLKLKQMMNGENI